MTKYNNPSFSSGISADAGETAESNPKRIKQQIGPYLVTVLLTADNRFISIEQVEIEKNFLSMQQRLRILASHDVEKYFEEDDEGGTE